MIAIVDYDAGNLKSVEKALIYIGENPVVTSDADTILNADKVILPGVGAFGDAMEKLHARGLVDVLKKVAAKGTPLLGICLGMQLLFDSSEEAASDVSGLSILPGKICHFPENTDLKIPHMGWNSLEFPKESPLFAGIEKGSYVYFVHSYSAVKCEPYISAVTDYGVEITAAVEKGNVYGTQFHPEKSGEIGLKILKNFCNI